MQPSPDLQLNFAGPLISSSKNSSMSRRHDSGDHTYGLGGLLTDAALFTAKHPILDATAFDVLTSGNCGILLVFGFDAGRARVQCAIERFYLANPKLEGTFGGVGIAAKSDLRWAVR